MYPQSFQENEKWTHQSEYCCLPRPIQPKQKNYMKEEKVRKKFICNYLTRGTTGVLPYEGIVRMRTLQIKKFEMNDCKWDNGRNNQDGWLQSIRSKK